MNYICFIKLINVMKVSYGKRVDSEGTVYNQAISMTDTEFHNIFTKLQEEIEGGYPNIAKYKNGESKIYLASNLSRKLKVAKGLIFLNLTQRRFVENYLSTDVLKKVKDRNTCLLVDGVWKRSSGTIMGFVKNQIGLITKGSWY